MTTRGLQPPVLTLNPLLHHYLIQEPCNCATSGDLIPTKKKGPVRAVFGGCFAGQLLSERACCGLRVWLRLWARAAYCWWVWLVAACPAGCLASGLAVVEPVHAIPPSIKAMAHKGE